MIPLIRTACHLLTLFFAGHTMSTCRNFYSDLCGYNGTEYNTTGIESNTTEIEGCNGNDICDCQQVKFCSVIELSEECNSAIIQTNGNKYVTLPTQLHCNALALDSQANIQVHDVLRQSENEITFKFSSEFNFGRYKIFCNPLEFTASNYSQWEIVEVNPAEVSVDSEVKLQLTVAREAKMNSPPTQCFIKTPDRNIEIFSVSWVSDTQIDCTGFNPVIPGVFLVSLGSFLTPNIFEDAITVNVTSKHPIAQQAEYNYDFETIFIYFDENIELHSTCASVFSESSLNSFGVGFDCSTKGNVLMINMGPQFKITNFVEITNGSAICRAGCQGPEFCLFALPAHLVISRPKLSGPNLSFSVDSACAGGGTRKHVSVKIMSSRRVSPEGQSLPLKHSGKEQRRNLMMWRMLRQFQSKLSSNRIAVQLNGTEIHPLVESLPSVNNILDADDNITASTVAVSVFIQSSPGGSSILAEADLTFCDDSVKLFRYKWVVNEKDVFEDGKLLSLRNLAAGTYVVKCMIIDHNNTDVLGQGWATAEILTGEEKVVIVPSETTVGAADDILLRALTWHGNSVSWSCRKKPDGDCLTTDGKLLRDVMNLNSTIVSIRGGSLPVGVYVWTVENARGPNEAKVFVKDGNITQISVELPSPFVKPSQEVVVRATVKRMQSGCRAWWSSVRQKGFDYFDLNPLQNGAKVEDPLTAQYPTTEIPLVIPSEAWKRADSDSLYLFQLQVFCPYNSHNHFDHVKVPLVVSNPPFVSPLTVHPPTGEAMITKFAISGGEADASPDEHPLVYEWSYVDMCDLETPLGRGAFSRNITTYLPPGDLKLIVRVCSGKKTCTTASTPTVSVIQSSEFPADNFRVARTQIQRLMTSGDVLEASALAVTLFKSLALLAESKAREEVLSTVENAIAARMEHFTGGARSHPKYVELALEFFERAITVAEYFPKGSDLTNRLMEFRKSIDKE